MRAVQQPILNVERLGVSFGGIRAVQDVSLSVSPGEVFTIIGPNGAGKTTLFNLISGIYLPHEGEVRLAGEDVTGMPPEKLARRGLSRTFQNLQIFGEMTALENVMVGRHLFERIGGLAQLLMLPSVQRQNRATEKAALDHLASVGLADLAEKQAGSLPYGALKRLEIARALAAEPKILLLDEPAAGCNPVETRQLDEIIVKIARDGVAVVLVEHDMHLVMKISDRIHVLDRGTTLTEGTPKEVAENPHVIEAYLGARGASRKRAHAVD